MTINNDYYKNLQSVVDNIPVPDVSSLNSLSPDELKEASDFTTSQLTKVGDTCNQALSGVTDKACEQLELILPILTVPTDPEEILDYLSNIAAIYLKPYDDLLATITDMIPVSRLISVDYTTKIKEVQDAFSAVTSVPSPPVPSAPSVSIVVPCQ